jgi:PKD repeat protein
MLRLTRFQCVVLVTCAVTVACGGSSPMSVAAPTPTPFPATTPPSAAQLTLTLTPPTGAIRAGEPASFTFTITMSGESAADLAVDFGDGTTQDLGSLGAGTTVVVVVHTYRAAGHYMLTAIVTGRPGFKATAASSVFVN